MNAVDALLGFTLMTASMPAAELQSATLTAWDEYIRGADSSMQARLDAQGPFLWADEAPDRRSRLVHGEIQVAPVTGHGTRRVPHGLIHHWIGAVFIPHASVQGLLSVVHDYDGYKEFYKPVVVDSNMLACTETGLEFNMIWHHRVLFVDTAVEEQYQAHDFAVDARRGYNIADTTRVQEIEGYGQSGEHLLPAGHGNGFIWRVHSIARYQERDGGVYLELEAIVLTRDIPASLRLVVNPVVIHLSSNSLLTTLRQTRDAVNSLGSQPVRLASCVIGSRTPPNARVGAEN